MLATPAYQAVVTGSVLRRAENPNLNKKPQSCGLHVLVAHRSQMQCPDVVACQQALELQRLCLLAEPQPADVCSMLCWHQTSICGRQFCNR